MLRLAALALALLATWAFAHHVPLGGRTVADRWREAPDVVSFLAAARRDLAAGEASPEDYTPAERRALERLLSERGR